MVQATDADARVVVVVIVGGGGGGRRRVGVYDDWGVDGGEGNVVDPLRWTLADCCVHLCLHCIELICLVPSNRKCEDDNYCTMKMKKVSCSVQYCQWRWL